MLKTKLILSCILLSSLCVGCSSVEKIENNNETPSQIVETQNNQENENVESNSSSTELNKEEFETIFNLPSSYESLPFGSIEDEVHDGYSTVKYSDGTTLTFDTESKEFLSLKTQSNSIEHIRGIKVGDSYESVLEKFANNNNEVVIDEGSGDEYKILYGDFTDYYSMPQHENCAVVDMVDGKPTSISYISEYRHYKLTIENSIVTEISYWFGEIS